MHPPVDADVRLPRLYRVLLPAAMGAWAATQEDDPRFHGRPVVSISGDGGFGQYLAEVTTAVKYGMNITYTAVQQRAGKDQQGTEGGQLGGLADLPAQPKLLGVRRAVWCPGCRGADQRGTGLGDRQGACSPWCKPGGNPLRRGTGVSHDRAADDTGDPGPRRGLLIPFITTRGDRCAAADRPVRQTNKPQRCSITGAPGSLCGWAQNTKRRSDGPAVEALPDERGGNRQARP